MKLVGVVIRGFRSIDNTQLPEVGSLNVLIGKNNSGKSTILSSVDTFFKCIKDSRVLSLDPPIGRRIDYHNQNLQSPLEIALTFQMSTSVAARLQEEVGVAAPQLRAATAALGNALFLCATLSIVPEPDRFSYVKSLEVLQHAKTDKELRPLMRIGIDAAKELAGRQRTIRSSREMVENIDKFLQGIDEEDFKRIKAETDGRTGIRYNYIGRRLLGEASSSNILALESIVRASTSYAELRSNLASHKELVTDEITKASNEPITRTIETFSGEQYSVPSYALTLLEALAGINVLYLTERRDPVGRAEATQLLSYKVTRGGTETLRQIQQTINNLLGVQVDAFESAQSNSSSRTGELDVDNFLLEVNGSGIKEALRLILDVEFKKPDLLLVEEPEVHLHPALETNMMRYLRKKSESCQVLLSTHSTNFLDSFEMKNVYFITKLDSKTEVELLNIEGAESKIPKELGIRLSSFFMFDRLVFVEGPTDEAVIREFASTLDINLSHANVGFIHLGGVRNFAHYATETIFSFLTKRQVKLWFLLDRDERDEIEITKMIEKLQGKAALNFLSKRELENYLIQPRPLTEFIQWKQSQNRGKFEINEVLVRAAIERAAETLKGFAIAKRAAKLVLFPVYPKIDWDHAETPDTVLTKLTSEFEKLHASLTEAEARIDSAITQSKESIGHDWARSKNDLVPGDFLLDLACGEFGTRFKKESDSAKLAALFGRNEIDSEISRLIKEIAS